MNRDALDRTAWTPRHHPRPGPFSRHCPLPELVVPPVGKQSEFEPAVYPLLPLDGAPLLVPVAMPPALVVLPPNPLLVVLPPKPLLVVLPPNPLLVVLPPKPLLVAVPPLLLAVVPPPLLVVGAPLDVLVPMPPLDVVPLAPEELAPRLLPDAVVHFGLEVVVWPSSSSSHATTAVASPLASTTTIPASHGSRIPKS